MSGGVTGMTNDSLLRCMAKTSAGMLGRVVIYGSYAVVTVAVLWILGNVVIALRHPLETIHEILVVILWWVYTVEVWVLSISTYSSDIWLHFYLFVLALLLAYTVLVLLFVLALFALFLALFAFVLFAVFTGKKVSEAYPQYRKWIKGLVKQG
jgi:hypothetical protein